MLSKTVGTILFCWFVVAAGFAGTGNPPSQWDISGAGDPSIQGFATDISANLGDVVHFKINTNATAYHLDIYRMGYYGGDGAKIMATLTPTATLPQNQPACLTESSTGLNDCDSWAESASWMVPSTAQSGIYFAKVTRNDTGGASPCAGGGRPPNSPFCSNAQAQNCGMSPMVV